MSRSLREIIYQKIRDDITYGYLNPGERLIEERLAKKFRASRIPIREALCHLQSEGLIELERNKGITVSKLSTKEVEEIYNLRWLLESYAARLFAERATERHVAHLKGLNEKLKLAAKAYDLKEWLGKNTLFHDFISDHCGNSNLVSILNILKRRIYRYKYMIVRIPGHFGDYIRHHEGIEKACKKRDGLMAEEYMKLHLDKIKEVLLAYLRIIE